MIRPLRLRHRMVVLALSALVPAAFVLGITSRRSLPAVVSIPSVIRSQSAASYKARWTRDELWEKQQLRTRLLEDPTGSSLALEITSPEPIVRPDVLLYWIPGNPAIADSLPNDSVLVGAWIQEPPKAIELPQTAKGDGRLILYSLADHEILNVSKAFPIQ